MTSVSFVFKADITSYYIYKINIHDKTMKIKNNNTNKNNSNSCS